MDDFALKKAFKRRTYTAGQCTQAIRGLGIPQSLGSPASRACVARGIRYHPGFALELQCKHDQDRFFTRAINARRIMSNEIPNLQNAREIPYCIWYPETANEATYRALVLQYPSLKYHVGRACAVAGYTDLYRELDLLPEAHIAEEARDNGSNAIFEMIMASPVRYRVMNDYTRTVNLENPPVGGLNGDTAVRSFLERKQRHSGLANRPGLKDLLWNITEDMNVDEFDSEQPPIQDVSEFLYTPLPFDLPNIDKDLLILMAAWNGDVDRYSRLRRHVMIDKEFACVIHGICHQTLFAKWWSIQAPLEDKRKNKRLQRAITARFIMSNDLSRIPLRPAFEIPPPPQPHREPHDNAFSQEFPSCIWYPNLAEPETYRELAYREPRMALTVARACIIANYQAVYQTLDFFPTRALIREAEQQPSTFYTNDLKCRAERHGGILDTAEGSNWEEHSMVENMRLFNTKLSEVTTADDIDMYPSGIFNGEEAPDVGTILLNVCAPSSVKSGYTATPLSEVYTAAGAPLKMPLGIDADLPARGYLGTALIYNNRPWVPHSPDEERDSE
ncbi:uncharacterized protein N7484_001182 [Penicillium longicatenatum]|uniref:uncharacterized protein n=1 Tax=Penicillium longicatenatum TaxID=1561947 RepID=UPI002547EEA9|nr:uncharacterized protein N7484_001182 [Penicillium longicatenatum]KAJ5657533.1 hypothetical protein N7484_001182 [Penicillium longicatenatum]